MMSPSNGLVNSPNIAMVAITEREESLLDSGDKENVYLYGEINLDKAEDIKAIRDYNIYYKNHLGMLYSNFNYEAANFTLVPQFNGKETENVVRWGPCTDPLTWFKYNHCLLGKPKRVMVYNPDKYNAVIRRRERI